MNVLAVHTGGVHPVLAGVQSRSCVKSKGRNPVAFDYFYGQRADQYAFYRIPKVLFSDKRFENLSTDAKLLYGILLDRMGLSLKNGWTDGEGHVYIIYTIEEIMDAMRCADQKATRLLRELEASGGLIERKRRGLGRPNLIYVKDFMSGRSIHQQQNRENHESRTEKTKPADP